MLHMTSHRNLYNNCKFTLAHTLLAQQWHWKVKLIGLVSFCFETNLTLTSHPRPRDNAEHFQMRTSATIAIVTSQSVSQWVRECSTMDACEITANDCLCREPTPTSTCISIRLYSTTSETHNSQLGDVAVVVFCTTCRVSGCSCVLSLPC